MKGERSFLSSWLLKQSNMNEKFLVNSAIIVSLIALVAFLVINSQTELRKNRKCQQERIIPISEKYFTWEGINELIGKGEYQPKCL